MQKKIFFFLGLLAKLLSITTTAQKSLDISKKDNQSLLWKITGKGLVKPSYLFGTIHLICKNDYFFNTPMKNAFNECEKLILEIDLKDPNTIKEYQQAMMLPAGKELKNFFETEKDFNFFSEKIKKQTGIDASLFQNLKPIILLSLIAQKSLECENTSSYEMNLLAMSEENKMTVEGLETSLSQVKIFDDMKDEEIRGLLLNGIEDLERDQKLQNQMIEAYKNQNLNALLSLILSSKELQNQEEALLTNRNKDWVTKLPKMMEEKPCFIAVGAGHLAGPKGVINLLKQAGYTVTPEAN